MNKLVLYIDNGLTAILSEQIIKCVKNSDTTLFYLNDGKVFTANQDFSVFKGKLCEWNFTESGEDALLNNSYKNLLTV